MRSVVSSVSPKATGGLLREKKRRLAYSYCSPVTVWTSGPPHVWPVMEAFLLGGLDVKRRSSAVRLKRSTPGVQRERVVFFSL